MESMNAPRYLGVCSLDIGVEEWLVHIDMVGFWGSRVLETLIQTPYTTTRVLELMPRRFQLQCHRYAT